MPRSDFAELVTAKDVVWLRVFAGVEGTEKECVWLVLAVVRWMVDVVIGTAHQSPQMRS